MNTSCIVFKYDFFPFLLDSNSEDGPESRRGEVTQLQFSGNFDN